MKNTDMKVEQRLVADLIPYARNSRTHSDEQVAQLAASIKEFGWMNPIIIDADGGLIAGHGRLMAAQKLKIDKVPCIVADHLTEAQRKAYVIADNRLALSAGWDTELLKIEIQELSDMDFNLDLLGFEQMEIDELFASDTVEELPPGGEGEGEREPPLQPVARPGDVWQLGRHRLMCGDSTSADDVETLIADNKINMVYTDPPYGVSIVHSGKIGSTNVAKANNYAPIIGDDSIETAIDAYNLCAALNIPVMIFWGGNYYASALPNSSCWIIWDKENTGDYADAELAWTNQKTAVRIFKHMWNGMIKASEHGEKRIHPTQKPIALAEWCFDEYGQPGDKVLDLFMGSGATLIACEKNDRTCFGMEMSPAYIDVIIQRWQAVSDEKAILVGDGRSFDILKEARLN